MKIKIVFFLLLMINWLSAQTKGVVKDSLTGKPIPYVSIWSENENAGITSEENGTFTINTTEKTKTLIFSSLGFEKKKVSVSKVAIVYLKETTLQLDEVVIQNRKETKRREIGRIDSNILESFENQPKIDLKFFPYESEYRRTKYIKKVGLITDSRLDDASIKIHFYSVDANGFPDKELLDRDFIVTVNRGNNKTLFDVTKFNLAVPKTGIFVGFEKLMIEKNKVEDRNTYYPLVLYNWTAREPSFIFSGGKWSKRIKTDLTEKSMIYEPAINLILTN